MVAHRNVEGNEAEENERVELSANNLLPIRPRVPQAGSSSLERLTHLRPFRSLDDFQTISMTTAMLERSGFYWGPLTAKQAHSQLKDQPVGTFLVRDSSQKDVFFTLSYNSSSGPINIRINFYGLRFSLSGSKETFDSLFRLLEYYVASPKKILTKPCRRVKVQSLQDLCRRRIIETCGAQKIDRIPVNAVLKDFLHSFPYQL